MCNIDETSYIASIRINPIELRNKLQKLSSKYEIVVFSILPKDIIKQVYDLIPDIDDYISLTLNYDDVVFKNGYAYKDIGLFDKNRFKDIEHGFQQSDIILVDPYDKEEYIDRTYMAILNTKPYGKVDCDLPNKWSSQITSTKYTNFDEIIAKLDWQNDLANSSP